MPTNFVTQGADSSRLSILPDVAVELLRRDVFTAKTPVNASDPNA